MKIHLKTELAYFIPVVLDSKRQICEREPETDAVSQHSTIKIQFLEQLRWQWLIVNRGIVEWYGKKTTFQRQPIPQVSASLCGARVPFTVSGGCLGFIFHIISHCQSETLERIYNPESKRGGMLCYVNKNRVQSFSCLTVFTNIGLTKYYRAHVVISFIQSCFSNLASSWLLNDWACRGCSFYTRISLVSSCINVCTKLILHQLYFATS